MNFKPIFVEGTNLDDTWFQLLWNVFEYGRKYYISSGSYEGSYRYAFDSVSGFIHYPHTRPLAPQIPESSNLYPPSTDSVIDEYFSNYLMNSDLAENEDYKYGTWIVGGWYKLPKMCGLKWPEGEGGTFIPDDENGYVWIYVPNQLEWVINHFKQKGLGNAHCFITIGYPESNFAYDIPYETEAERRTSPCLRGLDFRVIDNCLLTNVVYRSWDLVSGWPTNMGGFTLLNEYVADALGIKPGPLSFSCKDLHSYDHGYNYLKQRIGKE